MRPELPEPAASLGDDALVAALLDALRFRAYPEVPRTLEALRRRGIRLVVVSNWDVSLHERLAELRLAPLLDGVLASAEFGAAKPDPSIFAAALELAGAAPEEAWHAGDSPEADVAGALAAGVTPVLVARDGQPAPPGVHADRGARRPTLLGPVTSVPPPSGPEPLLRPELPDGLPPERIPPPPAARTRRDGLPAWPPWAPFAAMLVTLGIAILGATLATVVAQLAGYDVDAGDPPPGVTITGTFFQDGALILSAWLMARLTAARRPPRSSGCAGWRSGARSAGSSPPGSRSSPSPASGPLRSSIKENDDLPQELGADDSSTALFFVAVLVCVAAPIAEELFFRGFCFTALRRWIGVAGGAIATGVIFGLIHAGSADVGLPGPARRVRSAAVPALPPHGVAAAVHGAARAQQLARARRLPELGAARR